MMLDLVNIDEQKFGEISLEHIPSKSDLVQTYSGERYFVLNVIHVAQMEGNSKIRLIVKGAPNA